MIKKYRLYFLTTILINISVGYFFVLTTTPFKKILSIYIFLFFLFFLTNIIKRNLFKKTSNHPFLLLSINFLRILAATLFLLPTILNHPGPNKLFICNFFIAYFSMLFFDVFFYKSKTIRK